MKRLLSLLLIIVCNFTFIGGVNAHTNVSLCASGCDYDNIDDALDYGDENGDVFIHIMDDKVYELTKDHELTGRLGYIRISNADSGKANPTDTSINIEGNNHFIKVNQNNFAFLYYGSKEFNINNLNIGGLSGEGGNGIVYDFEPTLQSSSLNINNCNFERFSSSGISETNANVNIKNSTIGAFSNAIHNANIYNSNIDSVTNMLGNVNIYNSSLSAVNYIKAGYMDYIMNGGNYKDYNFIDFYSNDFGYPEDQVNTFVHSDKSKAMVEGSSFDINDILDDIVKDREASGSSSDEKVAKVEDGKIIALKDGEVILTVTTDSGHYIHNIKLTVIKKDETKKKAAITIKDKNKIKMVEVFSVLENYEGEVEWTISDPSIAKIENGEIIPLKSGTITVSTVIDGITYTYELTIADNVPEKLMHTTIKVPITGKDVEAWVIISTVISILVILAIVNLFIIKKKKNNKKGI